MARYTKPVAWDDENNLINQRLTWLGVFEGLLFTTYGFIFSADPEKVDEALRKQLEMMIPLFGLATSLLILLGVLAAMIAQCILSKCGEVKWGKKKSLGVNCVTTVMGWVCAGGLPLSFAIAWVFIGIQ